MSDRPPPLRYDDGTTETVTTPLPVTPAVAPVRPSGPSGRYVPGAEIARGGMGRVVVGTDTRLGREVAIKEALPQGADLERFEREVRITARLEHPSIVPLYDAGVTAAGRPFYVMRKVSGQPLERLIAERSGPETSPARGRELLEQRLALLPHVLAAAHAVGHAHRRGVLHRDIKPSNILVGDLGETVVIDWGLAKVIGEDEAAPPVDAAIAPSGDVATQAGAVFGTPGFMAPEQARGETLDTRSDVYALGATLYTVLAGEPPPHGSLAEQAARAPRKRRPEAARTWRKRRPDATLGALAALPLPPELLAIVGQAMRFDPVERYPDGAALADDLNHFLAGRLVAAHRYTPAQRLRRFVRRHRALVAVIAVSAILLATGGVLAIRGVVLERERAWEAEQAAKYAAERERDLADDAVIVKARGELEHDPTAAVATLATLPTASRRWIQARPIAIEARLRGIAHVYRADLPPTALELAPDPRSLLVAGVVHGKISIIDLEHNRERELAACPGRCTAAWGEGGAVVWVAPAAGGLHAVDVATGAARPPVLGAHDQVEIVRADPAATCLGFTLGDGRMGTLDASGIHLLPRVLSRTHGENTEVRVAPDAASIAFATSRELVVVDRSGRELLHETGAFHTATLGYAASSKQLAILASEVVLEIDLAGGRASVRRVTAPWPLVWVRYVKDTLYVNLNNALEVRPLHDLGNRYLEYERMPFNAETWHGHLALVTETLQVAGPTPRALRPPVRDAMYGVAARRDSRYLAVPVRGVIMTWDLGDMLPDPLASEQHRAWLVDDHTAVVSDLISHDCIDVATHARTRLPLPPGFVLWQRSDPATGRQVLQIGNTGTPDVAVVADCRRPGVTRIDVPGSRLINIAGPDLVVGTDAGELVVVGDGAPPRVVHRFDTAVDLLIGNGDWVVARAQSGALARFDRKTGAVDTARSPFTARFVLVGHSGDAYLAVQRDLYRWRGRGFERLATFPDPILSIEEIQDRANLVVLTENHAVYAVEPDRAGTDPMTRLFYRSQDQPVFDDLARYMAVDTSLGETTMFDLVRGVQWRLPARDHVVGIAPGGRFALLFTNGRASVTYLDMPDEPAALRAWVVQATNYTHDATAP